MPSGSATPALPFPKVVWRLGAPVALARKGLRSLKAHGAGATWRRATEGFALARSCRTFLSQPLFSDDELEEQRGHGSPEPLVVSVVVPLYNTDEGFLREMLASVTAQTYPLWELCLADGSDEAHAGVGRICRELASHDRRVRYQHLERNLGISGNSNEAIHMATGDYIALLDHDDLLHPAALHEVAETIRTHGADVVYTDEALFHRRPEDASIVHLKPAFAPDTLRAYNYVCHLTVFRRSLLERVGGFDPSCDGAQDFDLILRLTEVADCIAHIPEVLYYWRAHGTSSAEDVNAKPYAIEAGRRAVRHQLDRLGLQGEVDPALPGSPAYRVRYAIEGTPKVSVLIVDDGRPEDLRTCLTSIFEKTTWPAYEVVVVDDGSRPAGSARPYDELVRTHDNVCVATCERPLGHSAAGAYGARFCTGDYLLLLDSRAEVITPDWVQELLMFAQRRDVGVVGAKLYCGDGSIWHAGMGTGLQTTAGSYFRGAPGSALGYMKRLVLAQNLSAVSVACALVRRELWEQQAGLAEGLGGDLASVDLCLRMREAGHLVVWTPYAELRYHGTQSQERTAHEVGCDGQLSQVARCQLSIESDPYFNPNCDPTRADYAIGGPQQRHPARVWRSASGTHTSAIPRRDTTAELRPASEGADGSTTVSVIIPTLNAAPLIGHLLHRLLAQTVEPEVIVVDSRSDDATVPIVRSYGDRVRLLEIAREDFNHGATRDLALRQSRGSFVFFMTQDALPQDERCLERLLAPFADDADYVAWCDQDDVWDPTKLEVAVNALRSLAPGPALYCSDVRVVDAELHPLDGHMVRPMPADYQHALVRNLAPGCTFVFNRAARELLCRYDFMALGVELHDWFAFQVISCFGQVVYDPCTHLSYRQHGDNAIGAVRSQHLERLRKIPRFLLGSQRNSRERAARRLLLAYGSLMSPDQRRRTEDVARYRSDPRRRLRLLQASDLRLGLADRTMLDALVILGRL